MQPTTDFSFNMLFGGITGLTGFKLGDYDVDTGAMGFVSLSNEDVEDGVVVAGLTCDQYCSDRTTCASCMANDQCGWCSETSTCMFKESTCGSALLHSGCCPSCSVHSSCSTCLSEAGCGWSYDTGTCHSGVAGTDLCGLSSTPTWWQFTAADSSPTRCEACPGAVDASGSSVDPYRDAVAVFCSGHGVCGSDAVCTCDVGYAGFGCEKTCPGAPSNVCSGHGTCDGVSGECQCECGYSGSTCETTDGCACEADGPTTYCVIGDGCGR